MTSAEGQATAFFILYFLQSEFSSEKGTLLKVSESTGSGRLMGQVGSPCLTKKSKPKAVENLHHVYISITVCSSPFAALGIPFQLWLHFTFLGSTHSKFLETLCTLQPIGHKYHVFFFSHIAHQVYFLSVQGRLLWTERVYVCPCPPLPGAKPLWVEREPGSLGVRVLCISKMLSRSGKSGKSKPQHIRSMGRPSVPLHTE